MKIIMDHKNKIDIAIKYAIKFKKHCEKGLKQLNKIIDDGGTVNQTIYDQYSECVLMSLDDLKIKFLQLEGLKNSSDISMDEFTQAVIKTGIAPSTKEAIDKIFERREKSYLDHYRIDRNNPGLMFIVSQIIQDEMQVTRLRQDLFLIDSQAAFKQMNASDVDDAKKKVIDSIAKINKTIFEFTKYLDDEKSVIEQKESEVKEKEENKKEFGLSFKDFLDKKETDTKRKKAVEIQTSKANEYVSENLEADNVTHG